MVLDYVKTKHHLYFLNTKLKDEQILKFIDKILVKLGKGRLQKIVQKSKALESSPSQEYQAYEQEEGDDFDYLNDDDEYEEDYEDYEEEPQQPSIKNKENAKVQLPQSSFTTKQTLSASESSKPVQNKNTFMTYCQEEYDDGNGSE